MALKICDQQAQRLAGHFLCPKLEQQEHGHSNDKKKTNFFQFSSSVTRRRGRNINRDPGMLLMRLRNLINKGGFVANQIDTLRTLISLSKSVQ